MSTLFAFMMPGPMEMGIILVIAVLLFGSRLPKLAYSVGNSFTQFKKGLSEPMEELTECTDAIASQVNDVGRTVRNEHKDVKEAVENA